MNLSTECLGASRIESLLQGNFTSEEYATAQKHLELCEQCRAHVEESIGTKQWWGDVQSVLRDSPSAFLAKARVSTGTADPRDMPTAKLVDLLGPTDDPNMLGRIGPYEIIGLLGQGGMGAVFKGFDRSLNRCVAIKMLLPHMTASGAARKRFAREAQAVAAVVDDHVMPIHCVDEWQGIPYLVMPYSRGVSLQKRLSDEGPMEVREILRIGMQAAKGLAAAHAQGIVHRDIKPANIFLDQNVERVQLMDFGLARAVDDASLTCSGILAGTPQYMSPEQARAETIDHRSDLFSLSSVLYAMCTGHVPFQAESSYSVLRLITDKEPRPIREINPEIPDWLCAIISKLMSKQADDRFQTAKEVAGLLKDCLAHVQSPTTFPLPMEVKGLTPNRPTSFPIPIGVAIMCCLSIVAFLIVSQIIEPPQTTANSATVADSSLNESNKIARESVAVVMVMHPAELRNGNSIQRATATKTLGLLTARDHCGILRYNTSGTNWLWGDGTELPKVGEHREEWLAAIADSTTGDFPSLEPAFSMALDALKDLNVGQKLMIIFTDGDPIFVDETLIGKFRNTGIKVSVVHVDIHLLKEIPLLRRLTDATGGNYHYALESQATVVEKFFIREVQSLRAGSKAALQKIALAFHEIHDKVGRFPGSRMKLLDRHDHEFVHPFSWRVAILPYIGQQKLFDEYRFDEPWDSDNNVSLLKKMPDIYRSPHAPANQPLDYSDMLGFATEKGGLGLGGGEPISSFTDGTSKTILIVETAQSVPWTKPEDLTESKVQPIAGQPLRFVLADGSVAEMNPVDASKLEKMITRNGGELFEN